MGLNITWNTISKKLNSFISVTNRISQNCYSKNNIIRNFSIDKRRIINSHNNQSYYLRNLKISLPYTFNFKSSENLSRNCRYFYTRRFEDLFQHHLPSLQYNHRNCSSNNKNISPKSKKRIHKKKKSSGELNEMTAKGFHKESHNFLTFDPDFAIPDIKKRKSKSGYREFEIVGYAAADEIDLEAVSRAFHKQGLYVEVPIGSTAEKDEIDSMSAKKSTSKPDEVLLFSAAYTVSNEPRSMHVFGNGSIIFWNVPSLERQNILKFIKSYQTGSYEDKMVEEESEALVYTYTNSATRLKCKQDLILLNEGSEVDLEKFSYSNALAMSVKLGIWEASLDKYIDSIEHVTDKLQKSGVVALNQNQVLQKLGELFTLRHRINLSSGIVETPDFYWDHDRLEVFYNQLYNHLSISKRTSIMNMKLNNCSELMELLKGHLQDRHSSKLEWIIIILILVEVFFEVLHFL